jgi:hypothetical protein
MTEMDDRQQAPAVETAGSLETRAERESDNSRVLAAAAVVLAVLVPAAFIAGWRLGRVMGRLRGY